MKALYNLMMAYASMGMYLPFERHYKCVAKLTADEKAKIELARKKGALERLKRRGCKEWLIGDIEVLAINKKNAIRKANKIRIWKDSLANQ